MVTTLHNTGHGDMASTIIVTEDLGDQFDQRDMYVAVDRIKLDDEIPKNQGTCVFVRRRTMSRDKKQKLG